MPIFYLYFSGLSSPSTRKHRNLNKFFSFVKIEHTLFTLPLMYGGFVLGMRESPSIQLLLLTLLSAVGARTAAFALNRIIIDRNIDKRNPRTAIRELDLELRH